MKRLTGFGRKAMEEQMVEEWFSRISEMCNCILCV